MRFALFAALGLASCERSGCSRQLPAAKTDPLAKAAAGQGPVACSATEASCAEAASKILPQGMRPSPLEGNMRRLTDEVSGRVTGSPAMAQAIEAAAAAFRPE